MAIDSLQAAWVVNVYPFATALASTKWGEGGKRLPPFDLGVEDSFISQRRGSHGIDRVAERARAPLHPPLEPTQTREAHHLVRNAESRDIVTEPDKRCPASEEKYVRPSIEMLPFCSKRSVIEHVRHGP